MKKMLKLFGVIVAITLLSLSYSNVVNALPDDPPPEQTPPPPPPPPPLK